MVRLNRLAFAAICLFSLQAITDPQLDEMRTRFKVHGNATSSTPVGYSPVQIRHAYGFDQLTAAGAGQVIAIVDAYGSPTIQSDLNTFSQYYGLSPASLQIVYPSGAPTKKNSGWALETSLDVEWAHAVAPAAKLMLVVARSASTNDLLAAIDYAVSHGATQVSMSWGGTESSSDLNLESHFNYPSIAFVASSGDSGTGVIWPAVSPKVIGVGGTSLHLDTMGNVTSPETAWSGSGGGLSAVFTEPAYQTTFQNSGSRGVPDISYDADPATGVAVFDSTAYQGQSGWFEIGGTSAGAPQVAAMVALVNSSRATPLQNAPAALYGVDSKAGFYTDITSGCNGPTGTLTCAQAGYDFVTGLGSPLAPSLVPALGAY